MCNYQGYEFGAGSYPDSVCIDGKLFDADDCDGDGNLYVPGEEIPCPMCDPKGAVKYWTDLKQCGGISRRTAGKYARLLVADIRSNRGVNSMTATPTATNGDTP